MTYSTPPAPYSNHPSYPPPVVIVQKKRIWPWVLLGVFLVMILGFVGCTALIGGAIVEAEKPVSVHYEITGDAADADIHYSTWSDGAMTSSSEKATTLPWVKDFTAKGFGKGGTLTVSTGLDGGTVTCKVVIDGKEAEARTATASGQLAHAVCSGF